MNIYPIAIPHTTFNQSSDQEISDMTKSTNKIELICGNDLEPETVNWLWGGWLARGKIHILGGAPGTGKTNIALNLASILSKGDIWPDGTRAEAGQALIWSGEDDPKDTLLPRLMLSEANIAHIHFIGDRLAKGTRKSFDPAKDMEILQQTIIELGNVKLLIIDPIVSVIAMDSHKNAEVRRGLQPLAELASNTGCAVLGITHFSKGTAGRVPLERLTGSLAFAAVPRVVFVTTQSISTDDKDQGMQLFVRIKSNIGKDGDGFEYQLHEQSLDTHPDISASVVQWGKNVTGSPQELLAQAESSGNSEKHSVKKEAEHYLQELLKNGSLKSEDVMQAMQQAGYSIATTRRAKKSLNLNVYKENAAQHGAWHWQLPQDAQGAQ